MATARNRKVILEATTFYHCISRCVRKAFLCGMDKDTGKSYEHRRAWVEQSLLRLAKIFAIDVCAYAIMHNHTHSLLNVNEEMAEGWDVDEVLSRWHEIFKGTLLTRKFLSGGRHSLTKLEYQTVLETAAVYRERLKDISWFMRVLNEGIARKANKEDNCTGRFWEGRFKCQALLDESAVIACMIYIDLNPIRAGICKTLAESVHTSVYSKLNHTDKKYESLFGNHIAKNVALDNQSYLQILQHVADEVLTETSQAHPSYPCSLKISNVIEHNKLSELATSLESHFSGPIGSVVELTRFCKLNNLSRRPGLSKAKYFYQNGSNV